MATLLVCALIPAVARAETEAEKKQQARERYEKATRLYDVGKYSEAIAEYEQAYLLTGDPALLFNIGQAYRLWEHPEDAIRAYKNYLRQRPDASNRADVERKISDLERVVEERRRSAPQQPDSTAPPSAGYPPPVAPPTGYPPAPGVTPPPVPPAPVDSSEPTSGGTVEQIAASPPSKPGPSWLVYSLFGASGVCLVTAAIAGAVGASKAKKLQDASENREIFDPAVEANGKTANVWAVSAGALALATGGLGGYLFWRERKANRASVAVTPVLSPSFAGGSAAIVF
ncbi:MAG: hypothetical protein JXP73_11935 [Deltaproteobacteria bacterium]|nr:hypothetical protein [Deltaproteobacteria bacterium]